MPKYKCTYTSLEGAACQVMGGYGQPHPSHCHAYDTTIWAINPEKVCKNCMPLKPSEQPKKKIWCDQMSHCDSYNDGGSEKCENCPAGIVVFDLPKQGEPEVITRKEDLMIMEYLLEQNNQSFTLITLRHTSWLDSDHGEMWGIYRSSYCLNKNKKWEYPPLPSERDDDFYERCRWTSAEEALAFWDDYKASQKQYGV